MSTMRDASALLASAAAQIDEALKKFDTSEKPCRSCGHKVYSDLRQFRMHERLTQVRNKLTAFSRELLAFEREQTNSTTNEGDRHR